MTSPSDARYDAYVTAHRELIEVIDQLSESMLKHLAYLSAGMRDIAQFSLGVTEAPAHGCICGSTDDFHTEECIEANA